MQLFAKRGLMLLAVGSCVLSGAFGIAYASPRSGSVSTNPRSILSGNNLNPSINAPTTLCGNSFAVLGFARPGDCALSGSQNQATSGSTSSNPDATLSGNNISPSVNAPLTICGNALGNGSTAGDCPTGGLGSAGANAGSTSYNSGALGAGNNLTPAVNAPLVVCGNAFGLFGRASAAACDTRPGSSSRPGPSAHLSPDTRPTAASTHRPVPAPNTAEPAAGTGTNGSGLLGGTPRGPKASTGSGTTGTSKEPAKTVAAKPAAKRPVGTGRDSAQDQQSTTVRPAPSAGKSVRPGTGRQPVPVPSPSPQGVRPSRSPVVALPLSSCRGGLVGLLAGCQHGDPQPEAAVSSPTPEPAVDRPTPTPSAEPVAAAPVTQPVTIEADDPAVPAPYESQVEAAGGLPRTGGSTAWTAAILGALLLGSGTVLYRRSRPRRLHGSGS